MPIVDFPRTFKDGKLLMPEMVLKYDNDHMEFRGGIVKV